VHEGSNPVITAECMYPGSCHPKSFAGLGKVEPVNFRTKGQNLSMRKRKENGVCVYIYIWLSIST
jgi:hypothetical protein